MRLLALFGAIFLASPLFAQTLPTLATELGPVAPFTLTDHTGQPFSPEQLRGKVWVAHFFFTTCKQGCEKTLPTMLKLQEAFRGKRDLALVSISVNPDQDSPELLGEYAKDLKAEPGQWFFLSSTKGDIESIVQKSFFQALVTDPKAPKDQQITHSFNLLVIDREGKIVGYTDGRNPDIVENLTFRVRAVASERYILPAVNATLNALAGFLLVLGYCAIRSRKEVLHKAAMLAALCCSAVFLASYLYFHFAVLRGESPRFVGPGPIRILYLAILLTHTILAMAVAPLALYVTWQGIRDHRPRHVKVARWTFPIWLYVSITGVVVYVMLYHLYPPY